MPGRWVLSVVLFLTFSVGIAAQSDIFAQLGTTQADAHNSFFSTLATGVPALTGQAATFKTAEHTEKLAAFDGEYPADATTLIARRLDQFLDACGDVAFEAKLLEAKPAEWKMCYRAGKPAVDAARVAAQDWLKAIAR